MPFVEREWGRMWFDERGSDNDPRLLVINGSGSSLAENSPLLDVIGRRFGVFSFDHRGFGRSEAGRQPYTMADVADDAARLIDELCPTGCAVLGISYGGMVAQHLVIRHPDKVRRLVLACTSSGGDGGSSYPLHELGGLAEPERERLLPMLMDSRFTPTWLAAHEADRQLVRRRPDPDEATARAMALQFGARRRHDAWEALASVRCPVMVASGRFDGIAPPENGRRMADRITNAVYREFEGGHAFFVQDRTAVPVMMAFLAGEESA